MSSKTTHQVQKKFGLSSTAGVVSRFVVAAVVGFMFLAVPSSAQEADGEDEQLLSDETPTKLAEKLEDTGVYIGPGRSDVEAGSFEQAVKRAEEEGIEIIVLVPDRPEPDASAFARRMQERTNVDAAIVFPPDDGQVQAYASDEFESSRTRALDKAQEEDDRSTVLDVYVSELNSGGSRSVPIFVLALVLVVFGLLYAAYASSSMLDREREKRWVAAE